MAVLGSKRIALAEQVEGCLLSASPIQTETSVILINRQSFASDEVNLQVFKVIVIEVKPAFQ